MLCFHQCYYLASSFLIMFFLLKTFQWKECFVGCWLCIGICYAFGQNRVFSWGKYCARCCVFLYQGCFCCLPPACPSPLHLLRGNVKPSKDKGSSLKLHFQKKTVLKTSVDNIIFIESHISYWLPRSSCEPRPPSQYRKSGDMRKITKILKITSYSE